MIRKHISYPGCRLRQEALNKRVLQLYIALNNGLLYDNKDWILKNRTFGY